MGWLRQRWIQLSGQISWRRARGRANLMSKFAATELGSAYDMLAAAEITNRREMRRKYLEHALDEARHARIFRSRALALGISREKSALVEVGYLGEHGIIAGETLFERMGEIEFLAFVFDAEKRGLEQFNVYLNSESTDPQTKSALTEIARDEHFHMSYSRAALEKYGSGQKQSLLRKVVWRRYKEAWLRFSNIVGIFVSKIWLYLIYFIVVAPFRILARKEEPGWHSRKVVPSTATAHLQA
jgi:rubrerythrin